MSKSQCEKDLEIMTKSRDHWRKKSEQQKERIAELERHLGSRRVTNVNTDGVTTEMAIAIGLQPGLYNEREVYAMLRNSEDAIWSYFKQMIAMDTIIKSIDDDVAHYRRREELLEHIHKEDAGDLGKMLIQAGILAKGLGINIALAAKMANDRIKGIEKLINDKDDGGAELRDIILREGGLSVKALLWRDDQKFAGRQLNATEEPIDWLCKRLVEIYISEKMTRPDAYEKLFKEVQANQSDHPDAWKKLDTWAKDGNKGESLWRNVSNRPKLKEALENRKFS